MNNIEKLQAERDTLLKIMDGNMLDPGSKEYAQVVDQFERVDNLLKGWVKLENEKELKKTENDLKYEENRLRVHEIDTSERNSIRESRTNLITTIISSVTKLVCTGGAIFATLAACGLDETKVASRTAMNVAEKFTKNIL